MSNPLSDAYSAIWALLEQKQDFLALFPHGTPHQDREDTTLTYAPDQQTVEHAAADYPICRVSVGTINPETERDSSASYLHMRLTIEVCSGQQQQTLALNAAWAIFRSMLGWREYVMNVVRWNGSPCVEDVDVSRPFNSGGSVILTDQDKEASKGTHQWIQVWSTVVRLYFATEDLKGT